MKLQECKTLNKIEYKIAIPACEGIGKDVLRDPTTDGTQVMYSDGKPYLLFAEERCFPEISPDGKWFAFLYLCQWHHTGSQKSEYINRMG
jgi:hypothetical protein